MHAICRAAIDEALPDNPFPLSPWCSRQITEVRQMQISVENKAESKKAPRYWLLSWNPKHANEGGDAGIEAGVETHWSCHSRQPQPGDIFYLIRLGDGARGMVARGTVTQASFHGAHWRDADKMRAYIGITAEEVRPDCASGILPMLLLQKLAAERPFKWSVQSSGVEIPAGLAEQLDQQWHAGRGQHSLQQYLDWSMQDSEESRPEWLPNYRQRLAEAEAIRQGRAELDEAALIWLWRDGANGVCKVSPGFLPREVFERNKPFLRELTVQIMQEPSAGCYQRVLQQWAQAKAAGQFSRIYNAVIHRVFAAFAPTRFTTIVNKQDCEKLLRCLARDFELPVNPAGDWPALNAELRQCVDKFGSYTAMDAESNIALWQLFKAKERRNTVQDDEAISAADDDFQDDRLMTNAVALNQILYGPPGTGKTYETIYAALQILDPATADAYQQVDRDDESTVGERLAARAELKARFDELSAERRVRFVTFHQSFSYEDFVEGLRAETVNGQVQYRVADGVFKQVCTDAMHADLDQQDVFGQSIQILQSHFEQQDVLTLQTPRGKPFTVLSLSDTSFTAQPASSVDKGYTYPTPFESVRKIYHGRKDQVNSHHSYAEGMLNYLKAKCGLPDAPPPVSASQHRPRFVLIIDEINRGNISRIFGELITLIEPSKRAGAEEALSVTLPYSKDSFSVPDNVYIIGTMNTADRSLAGLDLALRRRFAFTEMPPRPELLDGVMVEGVNIGQMLRVMNQRITVLLDRDHTIGHAYFMPLQTAPTLAGLADIFRQKILPLLQEYFFEDWERIRWVLNDQNKLQDSAFIIEDRSLDVSALFKGVADKLRQSPQWRLNDGAFTKPDAYLGIAANLGQRVPDQPVTDGANT